VNQHYAGRSRYRPDHPYGPHRLLVAVECALGESALPVLALLDTGSEWCVLPGELARALGYDTSPEPLTPPLHARFGVLHGRLERIPIAFPAEEGEDLGVSATCFLSDDWPGPAVIGWKGLLERIRFGFDPAEESFFFSEQD
jgi:hypothetical protein